MGRFEAFQEADELVLQKLQEGDVDYVEIVSRVVETGFFRSLLQEGALAKLAEAYPSPRRKHDVPLWLYLSAELTLRLHGAPGFSSLPYVLHCGGLCDALEAGQVERKLDPESQQRGCLSFQGYNRKNLYNRRTPCDQDYVRKLAKDTDPEQLEAWYGTAVARHFQDVQAYDSEGVFFIDGSYLFIPDNENYELSRVARFNEHNHPVSKKEYAALTPAQQKRCRYRRYYQVVALSHSNRSQDSLLYAGSRVLREGHETAAFLPLVRTFQEGVGAGVMKTLVIDRGFIDGKAITEIKAEHGIDVVVPLKARMNVTEDAWRLAEIDPEPWQVWQPPQPVKPPEPPQRPAHRRRAEKRRQKTVAGKKADAGIKPPPRLQRVEFKVIPRTNLWDTCGVPIDVVLMREYDTEGECSQWGLMTTREVDDPVEIRRLYELRPSCEEGWRQTKCYWDLTGFRSPSFSLVVNQVVFVLLAFSLLQVFLLQSERGDLAKATRKRLLAQLLPEGEKVAVYWQNHVGYFTAQEYSEVLLTLSEGARRRLLGTIRRLRKSRLAPPALPTRPTP